MAVSTQEVIVVNPAATSVVVVSGTAVGPQGTIGPVGATGPTPVISATASTLPVGSTATATVSGSAVAPLVSFGIPTGATGITQTSIAPSDHSILWADTFTVSANVAVFDGGTPSAQLTSIKTRRGFASTWSGVNPTLDAGEFGYESDTTKFKIGTGSVAWNSLPYATAIVSSIAATGLTGETLATNVTTSSLTSFGTSPTLNSPTISGTASLSGTIVANSATITATELSYIDGVTSNIQTQLGTKAPTQDPTFTGTVTLPSGVTLTSPTLNSPTISGSVTGGTINGGGA